METYAADFKSIILQEAQSLLQACDQILETEIQKAITLILNCKGKIIVTGVGKSGIIANKIAATMTSTGTTAITLSASDAMHGDLGIITKDDLVIAISNSGETEEILAIIPHLKLRKVAILSIVGNINSSLSKASDAVLDAKIKLEAGHLNLAPTTSTTLALAIGDAIAMTVMKYKNITENDFAINHPSGRLGKRLALKVDDLMHQNLKSFSKNTTWKNIISAITESKLGAVAITDSENKLIGIITDGDIRRTIEKTDIYMIENLNAENFMTHSPISVLQNTLAYHALQTMESGNSQISLLPVIDENSVFKGIIRVHDIVGKI